MIYVYHSYRDRGVNLFVQDTPFDNIVNLSLNLRNTSDIAGLLIKIREQSIQEYTAKETENIDVIVPMLRPGHRIHGPRTVVHVIDKQVVTDKKTKNYDVNLIGSILDTELDKLCIRSVGNGFTIGIVTYGSSFELIDKIIEEKSSLSDNKIETFDIDSCYSVEYPAVIVLHDVLGTTAQHIRSLYLEISRARVYCVVIFMASCGSVSISNSVLALLDKLEDTVKIVRH